MAQRGEIYHVDLNPVEGREQNGQRFVLVVSATDFNRVCVPIVCPITTGGDFVRSAGFAVSLSGAGTRTVGVVRCDQPRRLASLMLGEDSVLSIEVDGEDAVTLSTRDPDRFYLMLNDLILKHDINVDLVTLADENVQSIYHYLSGKEHH